MAYGNGTNAPYGFKPIDHLFGLPWTGAIQNFYINNQTPYASNIFSGDPVVFDSGGTGFITLASAGSQMLGIFNGCQYTLPSGQLVNSPYWPASTVVATGTLIQASVICDPYVVYDIQTNQSSTGLVQANIGRNCNFAAGTGNTATGESAYVLDTTSSLGSLNTKNVTIIGLVGQSGNNVSNGNAFGVPYNSARVIINNGWFRAGVTTV